MNFVSFIRLPYTYLVWCCFSIESFVRFKKPIHFCAHLLNCFSVRLTSKQRRYFSVSFSHFTQTHFLYLCFHTIYLNKKNMRCFLGYFSFLLFPTRLVRCVWMGLKTKSSPFRTHQQQQKNTIAMTMIFMYWPKCVATIVQMVCVRFYDLTVVPITSALMFGFGSFLARFPSLPWNSVQFDFLLDSRFIFRMYNFHSANHIEQMSNCCHKIDEREISNKKKLFAYLHDLTSRATNKHIHRHITGQLFSRK